jgi:hypothetical protein
MGINALFYQITYLRDANASVSSLSQRMLGIRNFSTIVG